MDFFLGFDGGGSRTRAALVSGDGRMQATGEAGPANPHQVGCAGCEQNLVEALAVAQSDLARQYPGEVRLRSVFIGIAGISHAGALEQIQKFSTSHPFLSGARVGMDHDMRIAWAGAFGGLPGIVVVAGTGSSAYGQNAAEKSARCGGWGALLDDGGGGYWLGLEAIRAAVRAQDGRGRPSPLVDDVTDFLGTSDWHAVPGAVKALAREQIAALAPQVFSRAAEGDGVANQILDRGADELVALAAPLASKLFRDTRVDVALSGGLSKQHSYLERFTRGIESRVKEARFVAPRNSALAGAVLLAARLAGHTFQPGCNFKF